MMEYYAARRADLVIAVSEENRVDVVEQYGVPEDRMRVIPNGIRPERFHESRPDGPTILFVGRLHQRKGVDHLLRAMPEVLERAPETKLRIAGTGEREAQLKALKKELGLGEEVEFLGFVPDEDLPDLYASATVFTMPSLYEGFGIVMIEAMASSVPVVAFATGGAPEVIEDGVNGYLADPETLADHLADVLEDPAGAAAMGQRGRQLVEERYSWEAVARQTAAVYDEVA
jgi:glycosyltransferase involved in cell wall biosynthesis